MLPTWWGQTHNLLITSWTHVHLSPLGWLIKYSECHLLQVCLSTLMVNFTLKLYVIFLSMSKFILSVSVIWVQPAKCVSCPGGYISGILLMGPSLQHHYQCKYTNIFSPTYFLSVLKYFEASRAQLFKASLA